MAKGEGANTLIQLAEHANDASKRHEWPDEVEVNVAQPTAVSIFQKAQMQRAHDDWSPLDIVELARVSKLIAKSEAETAMADSGGTLVPGGKNGNAMICNPRLRVVSELNSAVNSSLRRLGINGASVPPSDTNLRARGSARREAERNVAAANRRIGQIDPLDDEPLV